MLKRIKDWLFLHSPILLQTKLANKKNWKAFENWESDESFTDVRMLSKEQLKGYLDSEWIRAKELDEKLAKLTASLAVSMAVGGVVSKTITDNNLNEDLKYVVLMLFLSSMLYFLVGAKISFNGLKPKPRYGYGARYLHLTSKKSLLSKKTMIEAVCAFQAMNLIRANEAYAATHHIRKGILCFGVGMSLSLIPENFLQIIDFSFFERHYSKASVKSDLKCCLHKQEFYIFPQKKDRSDINVFFTKHAVIEDFLRVEKEMISVTGE